ncbi:MAG: RHS repeat protein, partial [Pseudomonas sp.]
MSVASAVTSNVNFRYFTSLSGRVLRTESVDAGTSQALTDIEGRVVWQQDARGTEQRYEYDTLGRPLKRTETLKDAGARVQETWTYGESVANPESYNLRGQVLKHVDPAGTLDYATIGYGLDGAPLGQTRRVTGDSTDYTT